MCVFEYDTVISVRYVRLRFEYGSSEVRLDSVTVEYVWHGRERYVTFKNRMDYLFVRVRFCGALDGRVQFVREQFEHF